jgi:hypothetical protein
MKIDNNFIDKIFTLKMKLKNQSDKIKLSKYEEQIPMYDIYSQKIYPINKQNIHYRLIESHYRFINDEINQWLQNLYDKYKKDKILEPIFKYNIELINNYDIPTLIETSYKALYKFSPTLGLSVSICKRNSFNPFVQHLKPYYTKSELIKLGQNMGVIKTDIELEKLIDQDTHYNICKTVSDNDVSFEELKTHYEYIINSKLNNLMCFYSFTGSFLFNRYLRNSTKNIINSILYDGLLTIVKKMQDSPPLINDYNLYRFIWDDSFISDLSEGDIFLDKGFISSTRDPFYSPGLNGNFGLILLKIKLPKNKKGIGLFMENFSLFPKEEEFLIPPYSKLLLLSKNNNFKYYHTNPEFEKLINRKYEFEYVDTDYKLFYEENKSIKVKNKFIQMENILINGIDRIDIIRQFIQTYSENNKINLKVGLKNYSFNYQWFDSTNTSSYEKFYYNKIKDGMLFSLFDENFCPYLNIELGQELVINFLNKYFIGFTDKKIDNDILDLIYNFGRIFYYKTAKLFHEHITFSAFEANYPITNKVFLETNLFNKTIYDYLKSNIKIFASEPFIDYPVGYWYLDEYFNNSVDKEIINKYQVNYKNNKELFIDIVEKNFSLYSKIIELMDINIFKNSFVIFNIYDKIVAEGLGNVFKPNLEYTNDDNIDESFKLIFRQPIRRF